MRNIHRLSAATFVCASLFSAIGFAQESRPTEFVEALPEHLLYLYSSTRSDLGGEVLEQLVAGNRRWEPGRVLRVCLFGGNEVVATLIRQAASEWNSYASVRFDFGPPEGYNCLSPAAGFFQIRIGFASRGFWSALGTDSERRIDPSAPSMNFDGFNLAYAAPRMNASNVLSQAEPYHITAIKHEFGHALGLLHEHQNPSLGCRDEIKWTGPGNVYEYYAGPPNRWTPDQVQRNLGFIGQTDPDYIAGDSDPHSIMMYALPAAVLKRGSTSPCFVPVRHAISEKDKQIVARIYPPVSQAGVGADLDLKSATIRPLGVAATPSEISDATTRVLADLDSSDTFTRRDARARLADLIATLPPVKATALISQSDKGSYRVQLGTAVAVSNAPAGFRLTPEAKAVLASQAKAVTDPTLKRQLNLAMRR